MELPFACNSPEAPPGGLDEDSSLETASSQGSFLSSDHDVDPILIATPATVERNRMASVLSHFGVMDAPAAPSSRVTQPSPGATPEEMIDFTTYVNVWEPTNENDTDDIIVQADAPKREVLTLLLNGTDNDELAALVEKANEAAQIALESKVKGNLQKALDAHTTAAKLFRDAALISKAHHDTMTSSFLLLSQTQSKSALALKRAVKLRPNLLTMKSQKERLRATVRGAMDSRREADISESVFLGTASKTEDAASPDERKGNGNDQPSQSDPNAVDEMLQLEKELRDMDMALEMGNSIASLDARTKLSRSMVDGSFMVVPPGSSSSRNTIPRSSAHSKPSIPRSSRNRVQNMLEASRISVAPGSSTPTVSENQSLESSWWGGVAASQILSSSVVSMATITDPVVPMVPNSSDASPANTKQLMRLMESLKVLGDENATLLHQVEEAEAARNEAKAVRLQMQKFKEDYGKRFDALKAMLEKFRKGQPEGSVDPVSSSEYGKAASSETTQRQQMQLIRKLTTDLKREKDESKKKDAALKKYESFYLEVKARSAQKQRQREAQARKGGR